MKAPTVIRRALTNQLKHKKEDESTLVLHLNHNTVVVIQTEFGPVKINRHSTFHGKIVIRAPKAVRIEREKLLEKGNGL